MRIESRPNSTKQYFTRTFRSGGKLHKRYVGKASDPVAQLFFENEQLAKAERAAYRKSCRAEREDELEAVKSLDWLAQWSATWKVLAQLHEKKMHNKPARTSETERKLPGLHRFKEVCREAEAGDSEAQRQLDVWIAGTPEILKQATEMIAITREHLMRFVSSASPESSVLWEKQIDAKTVEILAEAGDDPLGRMYAEVTVLAWFDYARSSLMPYLVGGDIKRSGYWGVALRRSEKRWLQVEKAFGQHLKQAAKRRMSP